MCARIKKSSFTICQDFGQGRSRKKIESSLFNRKTFAQITTSIYSDKNLNHQLWVARVTNVNHLNLSLKELLLFLSSIGDPIFFQKDGMAFNCRLAMPKPKDKNRAETTCICRYYSMSTTHII